MDLPVPQQRSEFKCNCTSFLRILDLFDLLPPEDLSLFNIALILPMREHIIFVTKYHIYSKTKQKSWLGHYRLSRNE